MTRDERHEDFSDDPIRCVECGTYSCPDLTVSSSRGPLCHACGDREGLIDLAELAPLASGVHVSPSGGCVMDAADDLLAAADRFEHALGESRR